MTPCCPVCNVPGHVYTISRRLRAPVYRCANGCPVVTFTATPKVSA